MSEEGIKNVHGIISRVTPDGRSATVHVVGGDKMQPRIAVISPTTVGLFDIMTGAVSLEQGDLVAGDAIRVYDALKYVNIRMAPSVPD